MKKYLTKKRVCCILISISMLVSAIVMIPASIAHVGAEDLHFVEEPAQYVEPIMLPIDDDKEIQGDDPNPLGGEPVIILPVDDDEERQGDNPNPLGGESVLILPVNDDDERQGDSPPVFDDTTHIDTTYDNTTYDDTIYTVPDSDDIKQSMLRIEEIDFLVATNVSGANYLMNIVAGEVNLTQATFFEGDYDADTINAAIKAGIPVIARMSTGFTLHRTITVPSGHYIILTSDDSPYDFPLSMLTNIRHFIIEPDAVLIMQKAVLSAFTSVHPLTVGANAVRGGVLVNGGTLYMEDGAKIRNNHNRSAADGGGALTILSGEVIMNGGEITGNRSTSGNSNYRGGGGVYVGPDGKFTMNGGLIDNNLVAASTASDPLLTGGGGVYVEGEFNFNGGTISRNRTNTVAGIEHGGGGIFVAPGGRLTMRTFYDLTGEITGVITNNTSESFGGAILLRDGATLNLFGGNIYGNNAGTSKGITWFGGTINVGGNPIVGYDQNDDYIDRFTTTNDPNQIINIVEWLGFGARINVREHAGDKARPDNSDEELTVIARTIKKIGYAFDRDAKCFHYLGTGDPRSTWYVIPRDHGISHDLILSRPPVSSTQFAILRVPDSIHFGKRELYTPNLVGPYGDAPGASNVVSDYLKGADEWSYGFEIANTEHDNWTMTLQTTPFKSNTGIIGANPVAVHKNENNPIPKDLNGVPLRVITVTNTKGDIIKWHWTQLDYKIEAQTALGTVAEGDFQSVFTWSLLDVPN